MANLNTHLLRTLPTLPAFTDPKEARRVWVQWRNANGVPTAQAPELLTRPDHNVKLAKSAVPSYGLSLAPANVSGAWNSCPWSTRECRAVCLNTAGKGTLDKVQRGRILKTRFLAEYPREFLCILADETLKARDRHGEIRVRLNVLSDLEWERIAPDLFAIDGVTFYDYTKNLKRVSAGHRARMPKNYSLTFSASERVSDAQIGALTAAGVNVTVVFPKYVPDTFRGIPVVDGDKSDDRTLDPVGVVIGLKAKGKARSLPAGGFVRADGGGE